MEYKLSVNATDNEVLEMLGKLIKLDTIETIVNGDADDKTKVAIIKALVNSNETSGGLKNEMGE